MARRSCGSSWRPLRSCSRPPTTRWWRAGSTTRASRCSRGTPRPARRSARSSSGRTSARRRCSTGWERRKRRSARSAAFRSTRTSPPPSWPGCSRTRRRSSRRARPARCAWERSTPSCATASVRASPPTTPPRREPSCTGSARPASTSACASCSGCRLTCCPRCVTPRARLARFVTSPGRWSCRCAARWSTSRPRSPARAASCRGA